MALGIVPLTAVHTRKNAFDLYQIPDGYPAYPQQEQGPEVGDMKPVEPFDEIEKKKQEAKEWQEQEQRRKEGDPDEAEKKRMMQQLEMLKAFYTHFTPDGVGFQADKTKEALKQLLSKAIEQNVQQDKMTWESKQHQFRMEISRDAYLKQAAAVEQEKQAAARSGAAEDLATDPAQDQLEISEILEVTPLGGSGKDESKDDPKGRERKSSYRWMN
ncbi:MULTISPECIES: hypothetical protein [Paenibacillus]|uniref:hypothetical protein n=1 Tax=Paenibacillus TaxID=44249 RepID=UPI0022B8CAC8|nr:hypothetical protein [Paenibacillus caseinilyticus]MCZ8522849.1 hypothetical protein [Paenibacillus caseinilyticus]